MKHKYEATIVFESSYKPEDLTPDFLFYNIDQRVVGEYGSYVMDIKVLNEREIKEKNARDNLEYLLEKKNKLFLEIEQAVKEVDIVKGQLVRNGSNCTHPSRHECCNKIVQG